MLSSADDNDELRIILRQLRAIETNIRDLGIEHLMIIGSWARGTATERSDVDFVIEFAAEWRPSYFTAARVQALLEKTIDRSADVLLASAFPSNRTPIGEHVDVF